MIGRDLVGAYCYELNLAIHVRKVSGICTDLVL